MARTSGSGIASAGRSTDKRLSKDQRYRVHKKIKRDYDLAADLMSQLTELLEDVAERQRALGHAFGADETDGLVSHIETLPSICYDRHPAD